MPLAQTPGQCLVLGSTGVPMSLERKALVVDDDISIRLLVSRILERANFQVDVARDGAEAIEHLKRDDYAFIVLDLMMPRVDGATVIRYMKEHFPSKLPNTLVVSAFGAKAVESVSPPVGRFLEKPFDVTTLLNHAAECYYFWSAEN